MLVFMGFLIFLSDPADTSFVSSEYLAPVATSEMKLREYHSFGVCRRFEVTEYPVFSSQQEYRIEVRSYARLSSSCDQENLPEFKVDKNFLNENIKDFVEVINVNWNYIAESIQVENLDTKNCLIGSNPIDNILEIKDNYPEKSRTAYISFGSCIEGKTSYLEIIFHVNDTKPKVNIKSTNNID